MPNLREEKAAGDAGKPAWYQIYLSAMLEHDERKALAQIERAQRAIQDRLVELCSLPSTNPRELQDLKNAQTYLRILLDHVSANDGRLLWD